jgi:hypothetical protein
MADGLFYRFMCNYDRLWRRWNKVEKIDQLVSLSYGPHKGERRLMNDGSWIEPGDRLAMLHFNRECFVQAGTSPRDYARSGLRFRKMLIESFTQLATRMTTEENLRDVKALYGISWLPPHGEKVGFMIERVPDSALNNLRKFYFRLLLKTFFPVLAERENGRLQPHAFWLTRQNLLKHFAREPSTHEIESGTNSTGESRATDPVATPA